MIFIEREFILAGAWPAAGEWDVELCTGWNNLFQLCSCLNLQMGFDSQTLREVGGKKFTIIQNKD